MSNPYYRPPAPLVLYRPAVTSRTNVAPPSALQAYARAAADRLYSTVGCYSFTWHGAFTYAVDTGAAELNVPREELRVAILSYMTPRCRCGPGVRPRPDCI